MSAPPPQGIPIGIFRGECKASRFIRAQGFRKAGLGFWDSEGSGYRARLLQIAGAPCGPTSLFPNWMKST